MPCIPNLLAMLVCVAAASAFCPAGSPQQRTSPLSAWGRSAASKPSSGLPIFNKQTDKWEAAKDDDLSGTETFAMSPTGALLRQGPGPFIARLSSPDDYEQAVLKYQASERCSRVEAMANMDAYFNNAADWAYQKNAEKNGSPKVDYSILNWGQAAKVIVWALGITPFLGRIAYIAAVTGKTGVTLEDIFNF